MKVNRSGAQGDQCPAPEGIMTSLSALPSGKSRVNGPSAAESSKCSTGF
jgi:hypothetical protein